MFDNQANKVFARYGKKFSAQSILTINVKKNERKNKTKQNKRKENLDTNTKVNKCFHKSSLGYP